MSTTIIYRPEDLKAALDAAKGDATFLIAPSIERYSMNFWYGLDSGGDIEIRALDPNDPPFFSRVFLRDSSNITFDGIKFVSDNIERPSHWKDFEIETSKNITLRNVVAESVGTELYDPNDGSVRGNSFMSVKRSSDVTIENVEIAYYFDGFSFQAIDGLVFRNNVIEKIQNDGIHGGEFLNALIEGNVFQDFVGVESHFRHSDMIQIWSANANRPTQSVTIRDNLFLSNANIANQTIFIQNKVANGDIENYYKDILIQNNIIYNGSTNAIYVDATDGLKILDNTMIWDQQASSWWGGVAKNSAPKLWVRASATDVTIDGNVLALPVSYGPGAEGTNVVVSYDGNGAAFDVDAVFIGVPGASDLANLSFRPDGPLGGGSYGASASLFDPAPAQLSPVFSASVVDGVETDFALDARLSAGPEGPLYPGAAEFVWRLPGGDIRTGAVLRHDFVSDGVHEVTLEVREPGGATATATRLLEAPQSLRYRLAFGEDGPFDASSYALGFKTMRPSGVETTASGPAYRITTAQPLELGDRDAHLDKLSEFSVVLDVMPDGLSSTPQTLLFVNGGLDLRLLSDGELDLRLRTDSGADVALRTEGARLAADTWAHVIVSYDTHAATLAIFVNGAAFGSTSATGSLTQAGGAVWVVGHPWGKGFGGLVRGLEIRDDPLDAAAAAAAFEAAHPGGVASDGSGGASEPPDDGGGEEPGVPAPPPAGARPLGGDGDDQLVLQPAANNAWGGAGADSFRIDARSMPVGATLVIHDFRPEDGDTIILRHFAEGAFSDSVDPSNPLAAAYGGRHADIDTLADLREILGGATGLEADANGDAVLILPGGSGAVKLVLGGVPKTALAGEDETSETPPPSEDETPETPPAEDAGGDAAVLRVLRVGAESASGGGGADAFRVDARGIPAGTALEIYGFDPSDGDIITFRHFAEATFDDGADPSNPLTTGYGGRHADIDSFADLRELAVGRPALVADEEGHAVLHLPTDGGHIALHLLDVSYASVI